jgi:hypothetical protein
MNTYTITSFTSVDAGRQFPVYIEAADISTGSNLRRVRTVNKKVGQDVLERWQFNTVHTDGGPSNLKRVRNINKKGGKVILECGKARDAVKVTKPSHVSSALKVLKKIASVSSPLDAATTTTTTPSEPRFPSTPKRPTRLSSPPPFEYRKRTRVLKTTVSIEPLKLFYGPLFEGDEKACVQIFKISNNAQISVPKLWAAARD